jgi:GDP-L-fucose synthase
VNILITGGNGYIAKSLYQALKAKHSVMIISRKDFDLTNSEATNNFFRHRLFDVVIHCAVRGGSRLKTDETSVMDDNLQMYYNLLQNKNHFDRLIHFGSGAEKTMVDTPYGCSKSIIAKSINNQEGFYNLRIYSVFDENELDTRFIKANIKNYIQRKPIEIHQDKYMSFFYMKDLIKLVEYYIVDKNPQKEIECCYPFIYTLERVANMINCLDEYKVEVIIQKDSMGDHYYGTNIWSPNIEWLGIEYGIKEVHNKLK